MRTGLWPFGILFMWIASLRGLFYDWGWLKQVRVSKPVLCVGNIGAGGVGKTPWVKLISEFFQSQGKTVTILSRGYSGDFSGVMEVLPEADPAHCGDEPLWLSQNTKAQVFVGKSRFEAATKALETSSPDLFLMDDGFQHRHLWRDMDLVLLDASAPRSYYRPLPVGYLRETFSALKRAQVAVINKCNYAHAENLHWLKERCLEKLEADRLFYSDFLFSHWSLLTEGEQTGGKERKKAPKGRISMSCGVGNPQAFLKTLEEQQVPLVRKFIFPDHYYWRPQDIEKMTHTMHTENSSHLVITEKDGVKLNRYKKHFAEMNIQLWVCKMRIQLKAREQAFFNLLKEISS